MVTVSDLVLGASTFGGAKTITGAPRFWIRSLGFARSPGTTLTADTAAAGFWRDFPFSTSTGQLTTRSHSSWHLTVPGGGGGYSIEAISDSSLDSWLLTIPEGGGG